MDEHGPASPEAAERIDEEFDEGRPTVDSEGDEDMPEAVSALGGAGPEEPAPHAPPEPPLPETTNDEEQRPPAAEATG